ncbi:MAG: cell division protein FtsQ/DivIB [Acidaminococcaceae bacterium]|nr:cell division protein FtsQ/DivIB [Acidaminococcaceae bacterium]MCI2110687.1 cell division protein FtsQ/DivIB [Acidaminococcaceae bacterium]
MQTTEERINAQRRNNRHYNKPKIILVVICSLCVFGGLYFFLHRPWLAFGKIVVDNGQTITVEEVKKVANIHEPVNLFNINRSELEHILSHDLRIEKVTTKYSLPNVLHVIVKERKPAIYAECSYNGFAKISYSGHVLSVGNGIKDASAPFVSGWKVGNVYAGDMVQDEEIKGLIEFLGKLDTAVTKSIVEISLSPEGSIKVFLKNGVPVILGTPENAIKKMATFTIVCKELETKPIKAKYIDLTYDKPYVKLQ